MAFLNYNRRFGVEKSACVCHADLRKQELEDQVPEPQHSLRRHGPS